MTSGISMIRLTEEEKLNLHYRLGYLVSCEHKLDDITKAVVEFIETLKIEEEHESWNRVHISRDDKGNYTISSESNEPAEA
jgi:hypothetical protein